MNVTKKNKHACWSVSNGFGSVYLILLIELCISILLIIQMHMKSLILMKQQSVLEEKLEIQLVRHLKQRFYDYETEDEICVFQGIEVSITYISDLEARIEYFLDEWVIIEVTYDDISCCIMDFVYI